jgi:hypothetical protein
MRPRKTWFCGVVVSDEAAKVNPNNLSALNGFLEGSFYGFGQDEADFDLSTCATDDDIKRELGKRSKVNANEKVEPYRLISREARVGDRVFLSNYSGVVYSVGEITEAYRYSPVAGRRSSDPRSRFIHSIGVKWNRRESVYPWRRWMIEDFTEPKGGWSEEEGDRIELCLKKRIKLNTILAGAPGTGKTFRLKSAAVEACLASDDGFWGKDGVREKDGTVKIGSGLIYDKYDELLAAGRVEFVTFHQNYDYTDFIQGIRPTVGKEGVSYELVRGPLFRLANAAMHSLEAGNDSGFVLVIDEINRGNVAKIFGETITLIEESYRVSAHDGNQSLMIDLPGGVAPGGGLDKVCRTFSATRKFSLPANLSIIGTMNSTDRSIQKLDAALRRRFDFREILPDPSRLSENPSLKTFLERLNKRLERYKPGSGCQIGHAWLMVCGVPIPPCNENQLCDTFNNKIFPQLTEWFWDDPVSLGKLFGAASFMVNPETGIVQKLPYSIKNQDGSKKQEISSKEFLEKFCSQKKAEVTVDPDE